MKKYSKLFFSTLVAFFSFHSTDALTKPIMSRGLNILGYDPVWQKSNQAVFTDLDFDKITNAGFDTVRINLRPFKDSLNTDGTISSKWLYTLDHYIDVALKHHLTVIIDYHDTDNKCSTNFDVCEPQLLAFWTAISEHYKSYPDGLVFELLNEPHAPLSADRWNAATKALIQAIRQTNPSRTIVVSPVGFSAISQLKFLKLPDDGNIVATVHYYSPDAFTKQFKPQKDLWGRTTYLNWGSDSDFERLNSDFSELKQWSVNNNVAIFIGEFGVWDDVPMQSRSKYVSAVVAAAKERKIPWIYWQYEGDFRAIDTKNKQWIPEIKSALLSR